MSRSAVLAWTAVVVILLGSVGLVTYALTHTASPAATAQTTRTSSSVLEALSTVPVATFDSVGATVPGVELSPPRVVTGQPALMDRGKPEVLFVGAGFCPFCAAERWPLVLALSRFGRFEVLHDANSSDQSVFPGTSTFSFTGVRYSSDYVAFIGVELYSDQIGADGTFTRIAMLTPAQAALVIHAGGTGGWPSGGTAPFVDLGGHLVTTTSAFSPALLAGQSQGQIVGAVVAPQPAPVGTAAASAPATGPAIIAAANHLTAGICAASGQQPSSVCRSKGVRATDVLLGFPVPAAPAN
jgi:hypothetical protein